MTDQEYREIQLSGKQIVFLFMSLVVVAVVIFLLGVSVGRGVRTAGDAAQGAAPGDTIASVSPPPTQTAPGDLKYHSMLQGQPPAGGTPPPPATNPATPAPPPQTEPVPAEKQPPPSVDPRAGRAGTPDPVATAPGRGTATPPRQDPAPTAKPSGGWMVQVGAFRSRENADALVAQLKKKGHPAAIVRTPSVPNAPHIVRVGPFADRAEADRAAAVLAKEQGVVKPSVTR